MITEKELLDNGFQPNGEWNGRYYYVKGGFEIVSHFGVYKADNQNWSGYGKEIETIEELNNIFYSYLNKKIKRLEEELSELMRLRDYGTYSPSRNDKSVIRKL